MEGNITGISIFQIGHVSQDVVWVSTWTGNKGKYRTSSCAYREKGDSKLGMMQVEFTVSSSRCFIWLMILWHSCWKDEGPRGRWFPLVTSTWFQNQFTKKSRTSWDGIWVAKNIAKKLFFGMMSVPVCLFKDLKKPYRRIDVPSYYVHYIDWVFKSREKYYCIKYYLLASYHGASTKWSELCPW